MYTELYKNTKKILIIYATTSGNSQLVAEAVSDGINSTNNIAEVKKAELTQPKEINNYDATVLIASTWNVGLLNEKMIKFNKELNEMRFDNKFIEVIGLGDSTHYDIFCGASYILEKSVRNVGGKQLMETVRIDGNIYDRLEEFKNWGKDLIKKLIMI